MDAKERNGSEEKSFKAAVITVSDKGARGERVDESGPAAKEMLEEAGAFSSWFCCVPLSL